MNLLTRPMRQPSYRSMSGNISPSFGIRPRILATLLSLGTFGALAPVNAQQARPNTLPVFGQPISGNQDSRATVLNSANLAFSDAAEIRYDGVFAADEVYRSIQGHAVGLSAPLFGGLAVGFRFDAMNPPPGVGATFQADYQWFTTAIAYALNSSLAFGTSFQWANSKGPFAADLFLWNLAATYRPTTWMSISGLANSVNAPVNRYGSSMPATWDLATSFLPTGRKNVELGLEAKFFPAESLWRPRATLGIEIPYFGKINGEFQTTDPSQSNVEWLAAINLALYVNSSSGSLELNGGTVTGTAVAPSGTWSGTAGFALKIARENTGTEGFSHAVKYDFDHALGVREHVHTLRSLWSLVDEPSVKGVVFNIKSSPSSSYAHLQEMRDAIFYLQQNKIKVLCLLEDAGAGALYLCSAADWIQIAPAGGIRYAGQSVQRMYYRGLLDKLGIQADFVRIGDHKSAPESFTRKEATEVAKADTIDLLQQVEKSFVTGIAQGRKLSVDDVRYAAKKGPFLAREAFDSKLVDSVDFPDSLKRPMTQLFDGPISIGSSSRASRKSTHYATGRRLGIVYVDGDIMSGESKKIPFLGINIVGSDTISDTLRSLSNDPSIGSIVLRIESPGGSSVASDQMWREVQLAARQKPVIVSMGSIAASGGYYIASPATHVFANPLSITGSIGVYYGKANVQQLLGKLGLSTQTYRTSSHADAESIFRPFTSEERHVLSSKIDQIYDLFLDRVSEGRKLPKAEIDKIGQGRVWTGIQAKENHLVDDLGGIRQALAFARIAGGLDEDCQIAEYPVIHTSLLGSLLGIEGIHASETSALSELAESPIVQTAASLIAPFALYPEGQAMTRMEYATIFDL